MAPRWTTISCSALILIATASAAIRAQQRPAPFPSPRTRGARVDPTPLPFFPLRPLWTLSLNNAVTAPPVYDDTSGYFPIEGERIVAYDLTKGSLRWLAARGTTTAPAVGGGLLFITEPRLLIALRISDGSTAWQLPFADTLAVPLVFDNGWLIAATIDGSVLAFRASDGQLIWQRSVGAPPHARPALAADRVYVPTEDGRVVALQVATGDPVWQRRLGGAPNEILALEDRIFFGSKDNYFYCLDATTGEEAWRWRTGADASGLAAIDENTVYFVALDNVLRALNRKSGVQRWMRPLSLRPTSGPVKAGETLFVTGLSPTILGFNARDGKPAGDVATGGELAAPPVVIDNTAVGRSQLVYVTRDVAKGATVSAAVPSIDPALAELALLPNPVTLPKTLPRPGGTK